MIISYIILYDHSRRSLPLSQAGYFLLRLDKRASSIGRRICCRSQKNGASFVQAVSRGVGECHFVELDPFVLNQVLQPNINNCAPPNVCVTHLSKAEEFLRRVSKVPSAVSGAFDFISACPPYEKVSYPEVTHAACCATLTALQCKPLLWAVRGHPLRALSLDSPDAVTILSILSQLAAQTGS